MAQVKPSIKQFTRTSHFNRTSDAHLRLVARCHLGKGELKAAAALLQGSTDPENRSVNEGLWLSLYFGFDHPIPPVPTPIPTRAFRYLYAYCCVELDQLAEAEAALLPVEEGLLAAVREKGPQACKALLLAQVGGGT